MADHAIKVTLQIRSDSAQDWLSRNPTLTQGEYGLETDTFLIKVGDGVRDWEHLPYLNKLDSRYFTKQNDGSLTFSAEFAETINNLIANAGGSAEIVINNDPTEPTDPVNLRYLEWAIAHAGHLKREIVQTLPAVAEADENTIYLIASQTGVGYEEYMVISGAWDMVGTTSSSQGGYELQVATTARLGGVKASTDANRINVTQEGFMTLNQVSTSLLYVPDGDTLVIYGGTA